jgi:endoglucanase
VASFSIQGKTLYRSPYTPAQNAGVQKIANQPQAAWFGNWNSSVQSDVKNYVQAAAGQNSLPVLVLYNIPQRDCGGYSAGGSSSADAYKTWIQQVASGIGNNQAAIILEPDSLALMDCLSSTDQQRRYDLLKTAIQTLKQNSSTAVYLDAGHPNWISASTMGNRYALAGGALADGFSLNVSNFYDTSSVISYGTSLSQQTGGAHFVIDTSRNGNGAPSNGEWCNPSDRALGTPPTTSTGKSLVDAYLWIKNPGESDGTCNGGPSAGTWWTDYALGLSQRATW